LILIQFLSILHLQLYYNSTECVQFVAYTFVSELIAIFVLHFELFAKLLSRNLKCVTTYDELDKSKTLQCLNF